MLRDPLRMQLGVMITRRLLIGTAFISALLATNTANAFCRTTTCTAADGPCARDPETGCVEQGTKLFWPNNCVSFGVQSDASPTREIDFEEAERAAARAFQTWIGADCGDGEVPSIGVVPRGELFCDRVEFHHDPPAPNANLVVFRDGDWPHCDTGDPDSPLCNTDPTIALTTITYVRTTGEILDADIEINSANVDLTNSDQNVSTDLQSVLTHEIGHFFGLAHTQVERATMNARYDAGDLSFRSLHQDDAAGICAVYRPGDADPGRCDTERPRGGFSRHCGSESDDPDAAPLQADAACLCEVPGAGRSPVPGSRLLGFLGLSLLLLGSRRRMDTGNSA